MKFSKKNITVLALVLLLSSCKNENSKLVQKVKSRYSQKVILPDSLPVIQQGKFVSYLKDYKDDANLFLTAYIDAECGDCLFKFQEWKQVIEENSDLNVQVLLFVNAGNYGYLDYLLDDVDFDYPIVFDSTNVYLERNAIDAISEAMLVDSERNVVLVGSPINNPKLKELYYREIRKRL